MKSANIFDNQIQSPSEKDLSFIRILFLLIVIWLLLGFWMRFVNEKINSNSLQLPIKSDLYQGIEAERNPWLESWQRWDTLHYQAVAERGYTAFETALFTPPLYPLLMRWVAKLLGVSTLISGILVSNLAYLGSLISLYKLVLFEKQDPKIAFQSVLFLALFPTAFYFMGAFSESLFLLAAILLILVSRQRKWVLSGIFGGIAALTRITGFILPLPLGLIAIQDVLTNRVFRSFWSVVLTITGFAIFPLYVGVGLGMSPWEIVVASNQRGGYLTWPGANIIRSIELLFQGKLMFASIIDLIFTLLFLALAIPVWRKLPKLYSYYYLTIMLFYLIRMGPGTQPLLGMTRYVLVLFPAFMVMGEWGTRPWLNRIILYPSIILLFLFAGIFTSWGVI